MVNLQKLIKEGAKELRLFVHKCELDNNDYTNGVMWVGAMEEYNNTWVTFKANTVTNDWLFGGDLGSGAWTFTSEWLFESDCREEDNTLVAEHVDITESDWSEGYKQFLDEVSTLEEDDRTPEQSIKPVSDWTDKHYDFTYKHPVSESDAVLGYVNIKLDPYMVSKEWDLGGKDASGILFHITKTCARFGTKNSKAREIKALYAQVLRLAELNGVEL